MNKNILLYSSGIDSYIAREYLIKQKHIEHLKCVYFNHGGKYTSYELDKISKLPFKVIIDDTIKLEDIEGKDSFIPNRNILFSVLANARYGDNIWIGGSLSDRVCDNNKKVFDQLSNFLTMMNNRLIKISSPFWECYKEDMLQWFVKEMEFTNGVSKLLHNTFSCFQPIPDRIMTALISGEIIKYSTNECLKCSACFRKSAALYGIGVFIKFDNIKIIEKYQREFSRSLVSNRRTENTLDYIKTWWMLNVQ